MLLLLQLLVGAQAQRQLGYEVIPPIFGPEVDVLAYASNPAFYVDCPKFLNDTLSTSSLNGCAISLLESTTSLSGGSCLAVVMLVGLRVAGILNDVVQLLVFGKMEQGNLQRVTATSSGGTIFFVRAAVLEGFPIGNKYVYPCFKFSPRFREVCMFHQSLGASGDVCDSEFLAVVIQTVSKVFKEVIDSSGGARGVLGFVLTIFFFFIKNLPLSRGETRYLAYFSERFIPMSSLYAAPSVWSSGVDVVSPREAMPASPYNFGWPAHLPRSYESHIPFIERKQHQGSVKLTFGDAALANSNCSDPHGDIGWDMSSSWFANTSTTYIVWQSANYRGLINQFAFSLTGNNWDSTTGSASELANVKIFGLLISFVMTKRLVTQGMINLNGAPIGWPLCDTGCLTLDIGYMDNGPLTPNLAFISRLYSCKKPTFTQVFTPASSFAMFSFFMGQNKLDVWAGGGTGNNQCPLKDLSHCSTLTTIRELIKRSVPLDVLNTYLELGTSYSVWLPQNMLMSSYCGDPIAYDNFMGGCTAKSHCYMAITVIPSIKLGIQFTPSPLLTILSVIYLAPTALAKNFVHDFLPHKVFTIPAFRHIAVWFPAFTVDGKEKGGLGFFKVAGHALMDYLTFGLTRVTPNIVKAKQDANLLFIGHQPPCEFGNFEQVEAYTSGQIQFAVSQNADKQEPGKIIPDSWTARSRPT